LVASSQQYLFDSCMYSL